MNTIILFTLIIATVGTNCCHFRFYVLKHIRQRSSLSISKYENGNKPPLLEQRSNGSYGTTAGLGYSEVLELSKQILLFGQLASVRTVNSQRGRRIQLLYCTDLNTITNSSIQLQCIQARSLHPADKTTRKPQAKCCTLICSSSTSILYLYEL